ncbi:MAG: hypothetical protein VXY92_01710 [Planctomycetota bacterium]|nr:hypothetical protein [Planctomycetota bacterium]
MQKRIGQRAVAAAAAAALGGVALVTALAIGRGVDAPLLAREVDRAPRRSPAAAPIGARPLERTAAPELAQADDLRFLRVSPTKGGGAPAPSDEVDVRALIEDLRDDDERFNASYAMEQLRQLPAGDVPELERALDAADPQQRIMAARVLRARVAAGQTKASDALLDRLVATAVADLRDDDASFNAIHAADDLRRLRAGEQLEQALDSSDAQQRHLAALVLRGRVEAGRAEASPRLLEVTVDALTSDICQRVPGLLRMSGSSPEPWAARFLAPRARAARSALERGLQATDAQQRFLCGYLLAQAGMREHAAQITNELLGHLNDNDITGDAMMAAHGLYCLGPVIEPVLLDNWRFVDEQGRGLIRLIRLDFERPPRSRAELVARSGIADVSCLYHDAAVEYDIQRSSVPRFKR